MNLFEFINKNPYICPLCENYYNGLNYFKQDKINNVTQSLSCLKCRILISSKYNTDKNNSNYLFFNIIIQRYYAEQYGNYIMYSIEQNINTKEIKNYIFMGEDKSPGIYSYKFLTELSNILTFPNNLIEKFINNKIFL